MVEPNHITDAWIAGFFDGEGCVGVYFKGSYIEVFARIAQKNVEVLLEIKRIFPEFTGPNLEGKKRDNFSIGVWSQNSLNFLQRIRPHLVLKGTQVDIAIFALLLNQRYGGKGNIIPVEVRRLGEVLAQACCVEKTGRMSQEMVSSIEKELENCLRN